MTGTISKKHDYRLSNYKIVQVSRERVAGIATRYGFDGPETESRRRGGSPNPRRTALETTQSPVRWVSGLSWG